MKKRSARRTSALWAGGFATAPGPALSRLSVSHPFDRRLATQDIRGTRAHARGLARAGLLSKKDLTRIQKGLARIERELAEGRFVFTDGDEDIHLNVERRLIEITGESGKRIHAGRSRNDQVALDLRLWTLEAIGRTARALRDLGAVLLERAEALLADRIVVEARTHMRSAQPVLAAHLFHAYAEMLARDLERLRDSRRRTAVSPLGSGACAGTTLPISREGIARDLALQQISANSLDAVADRDFAAEFEAAAALAMVHLSRLAEDLVLWTGEEFRLFRLAESSTTGSSMMPQKRNPDSLELVRGKSGRVAGDFVATLVALKGLPLSYNRDLQETQEPLMDAADTLVLSLEAMRETVSGLQLVPAVERAAVASLSLSTDVAEALVARGVPFRTAHEKVARWVRLAAETRADLREIAAIEAPALQPFLARLTPESAVARRDVPGGTAPRRVRTAIVATRKKIERLAREIDKAERVP